jgi:fatty acid desaturase
MGGADDVFVLARLAPIIASSAHVVLWPNPATYILTVMIIGESQLGLAIIMHAAQVAFHPIAKENDVIGNWLCAAPLASRFERCRAYHLQHNKVTGQPQVPDIGLSRQISITRGSFWRKVVRDLSGHTYFKQRIIPTFQRQLQIAQGKRPLASMEQHFVRYLIVNGAAMIALTAAGFGGCTPRSGSSRTRCGTC